MAGEGEGSEPGFTGLQDYQDYQKREDGKLRSWEDGKTDDGRQTTDKMPQLFVILDIGGKLRRTVIYKKRGILEVIHAIMHPCTHAAMQPLMTND